MKHMNIQKYIEILQRQARIAGILQLILSVILLYTLQHSHNISVVLFLVACVTLIILIVSGLHNVIENEYM